MSTTRRRSGVLLGLALVLACVAAPAGPVAPAGATGPVTKTFPAGDATTSIVVSGAVTDGHTFDAYRIAAYADVTAVGGLPVGVTLATSAPELKRALGTEIAALEDARNGTAPPPAVSATGDVEGLDPLDWVTRHWSTPPGVVDLWGNSADLIGPLRDLADWLGTAVQHEPGHFGLTPTRVTGSREPGAPVATATFPDVSPGLYALAHPRPETDGHPTPGTSPGTLLIGTKVEVDGHFLDLYDQDGALRQTLGAAHVKGDGVTITKTLDDPAKASAPTFAVGDTVPVRITATLPRYDLFPATHPLRFEITDTHSVGLGLPDWQGADARLADPVLTVGGRTLRFDAACVVGLTNASDACYAVTEPSVAANNETSWTVSLPSWVARAHGGDDVVLTFEQLLTADARSAQTFGGVVGTADTNRASVTFSSNPQATDDVGSAATAPVTVFTFPLHLTKIDAARRTPLADVGFAVLTGGTRHCFRPADAGHYWHAGTAPCLAGTTDTPATAADGTLALHGLAGDVVYTVTETRVPQGYSRANLDVVRFTAQALPEFTPVGAPSAVRRLTYRFGNAGSAPHLADYFTTTSGTASVPTTAGNEHRDVLTEQVTVVNWVSAPRNLTTTGADTRNAFVAAGLLAVAAALFAVAAYRRRRSECGTTP